MTAPTPICRDCKHARAPMFAAGVGCIPAWHWATCQHPSVPVSPAVGEGPRLDDARSRHMPCGPSGLLFEPRVSARFGGWLARTWEAWAFGFALCAATTALLWWFG